LLAIPPIPRTKYIICWIDEAGIAEKIEIPGIRALKYSLRPMGVFEGLY